jgi:hypothetical protein
MFSDLLKGLNFLHAISFVVGAFGLFMFWARKRFWCPIYIHVMAAVALALGTWMMATIDDSAPICKYGSVGKVLIALCVPAMVYFVFVFYGGQRAAYESRFIEVPQCPRCQSPLPVDLRPGGPDGESPYTWQYCPRCGQAVGSTPTKKGGWKC